MKTIIKLTILLITINFTNPSSSFARDLTWTGTTSSDWNDSTNFSPSYVPTSADTVNIVSATNNPVLNGNTTLFSLNIQSGILDLDGHELKILKYSVFDGGIITGGTIQVEGNASFSGTEFESIVTASCAEIELNGSIFNEKSYFEITGTLPSEWHGGNIFHDSVIIVLNGGGNLFLTMQDPDQFLGTLNVINHTSHVIYLSYGDTAYYHKMISVANYHGGVIHFGKYGGVAMLQNNGSLIAERDSFNSGFLNLNDIYQLNSESITLELAGDATLQMADCNFQGQFELVSPDFLIRNSIFNEQTSLTKSGGVANVCEGGNTFMDTTTIINQSDRYSLTMHNTTGNIFHGKAIIQSDRGGINFGATATTPQEEFYSDIEVNSSYITFKKVVLTGTSNQQLGGTSDHSYNYIEINKPSGYVTATTKISVVNQFVFTLGNLITDTVNTVTFLAGSEVTGAHNGSFVNGPVKKVGNTAFEIPVGKEDFYRPISISAPDEVTDTFVAEYFAEKQSVGSSSDTILNAISSCEYWQLNRITGSSDIQVSLSWNSGSCAITYPENMRVACLNDTVWQDLGNDYFSGSLLNGVVRSADPSMVYNIFTLANVPVAYTGPPNLEDAYYFALLSGEVIISDSLSYSHGKAGSVNDVINILSSDSILTNNAGSVSAALNSLEQAIMYANGLSSTLVNDSIDGQSYSSGVYSFLGNTTVNDSIILNGDSSSVFIFNISGPLTVDSGAVVHLNGVNSYNVFWNINENYYGNEFISFPGIVLAKKKITAYRYHNPIQALMSLDSIILFAHEFDIGNNIFYSPFQQYIELTTLPINCNFVYDDCNEIRNSNFENFSIIPDAMSQLIRACPWYSPSPGPGGTPDYFHVNSSNTDISPPIMLAGCQLDNSSTIDAFGGFYSGGEYLQQELFNPLDPLNQNTLYYGEFFVVLNDKAISSVDQIGMHFSPSPVSQIGGQSINASPQIQSPGGQQLSDHDLWHRISGCFIGNSEAYVTIGTFNNTANYAPHTPNTSCLAPAGAQGGAYYTIDDPVVVKYEVNAGPDETVGCAGQVQLGLSTCITSLNTGQFSYSWNLVSGPSNIGTLDFNNIFNPILTINNTTGSQSVLVYEVTVTSSGGCTATDQVAVTSNPNLSVTLTPTHSCNGSPGSITSAVTGGTSPYSYLWSNNSTSANLINIAPGTYTVTVTDANGCTEIQTETVINDNTTFVIVGPEANCLSDYVLFDYAIVNYNSQNHMFYDWVVSSNLTIINENTSTGVATILFPDYEGGVITVNYFNTITNCSYSYTITVYDCCRDGDYILADVPLSDICNLDPSYCNTVGPTLFINTGSDEVTLNGLITVDQNTVVQSTTINFGEGARLNTNGQSLQFNNSYLKAGCAFMWRGIQVTANSVLRFISSRIEDAQYGLDVFNNGNYLVSDNSLFNLNYIGIRASGENFILRSITTTTFECTANLLPSFTNQTPVPCSRTFAGMELVGVLNGITIGDPTYGTNPVIFQNINMGILSRFSSVNVLNSEFLNIRTPGDNVCFNAATSIYRGSGIAQIGNTGRPASVLYQQGFGNLSTSDFSFNNCIFGVYSINSTIDVQYNHMNNVNTGVHDELAGSYMQNLILFNRILANRTGVRVLNPRPGAQVKVWDNDIFINNTLTGGQQGARHAGVHVNRTGVPFVPYLVAVRNNYIEVDFARMGILMDGINNTSALENVIDITSNGITKHGIWLANLNNNISSCNDLIQAGSVNNFGINARAVPNAIIGCNETFNFNRGVQLNGQSGGTQFQGNEMTGGNVGLFVVGSSTVIGPQIDKGNLWLGTFNIDGARMQVGNSPTSNLFRIEDPINPPLWPPTWNNAAWFQQSTCTNCTYECDTDPYACDHISPSFKSTITLLDTMVVNGDSLSEEWVVETLRQTRRDLYEDLFLNPDLVSQNGLMEDFFIDHADSAYAKFSEIRHLLNAVVDSNETLHNNIFSLAVERDSIMKLMLINDSLFWDGISGNDSLDLLNENEAYRDMIHEIDVLLDPMVEQLKDSIDSVVLLVSELNATLEYASIHECEVNEYKVNKISFDVYLEERDTLTGSEISILENIINQCPASGGKAVYEARSIYTKYVNDSIMFDDDTLCLAPSRLMITDKPIVDTKTGYYNIYPNPTSEFLFVEYFMEEQNEPIWLIINDISGRKVYEKLFSDFEGKYSLDVSGLNEGLYLCIIKSGKKSLFHKKIAIVR